MNDNITDMLQNLIATNSKTENHEEQLTEISSKLSNYEDRLEKTSIKEKQIHPFSLHMKNLQMKVPIQTSTKKKSQRYYPNYQTMKTAFKN